VTRANILLAAAAESRVDGQASSSYLEIYGNQVFTAVFTNIRTEV